MEETYEKRENVCNGMLEKKGGRKNLTRFTKYKKNWNNTYVNDSAQTHKHTRAADSCADSFCFV